MLIKIMSPLNYIWGFWTSRTQKRIWIHVLNQVMVQFRQANPCVSPWPGQLSRRSNPYSGSFTFEVVLRMFSARQSAVIGSDSPSWWTMTGHCPARVQALWGANLHVGPDCPAPIISAGTFLFRRSHTTFWINEDDSQIKVVRLEKTCNFSFDHLFIWGHLKDVLVQEKKP